MRDKRDARDGSDEEKSSEFPEFRVARFPLVSPLSLDIVASTMSMADNNAVYAIRFPDGSVSLYIDEEYAIERGVDPAKLTRVEIPRELLVSGTVQEVREYVALYLESHHSGTV